MAEAEQNQTPIFREDRRDKVPDLEPRSVTFAARKLSPERIEALREFLATASADEIAMVRQSYSDVPEVLEWIQAELGR